MRGDTAHKKAQGERFLEDSFLSVSAKVHDPLVIDHHLMSSILQYLRMYNSPSRH